jgi:HNH endonuclease
MVRDCDKSRNLEAHHIKSFKAIKVQYNIRTVQDAIGCDELWDINNGITLCRSCHLETKNHGGRKRKGIHSISVNQIAVSLQVKQQDQSSL